MAKHNIDSVIFNSRPAQHGAQDASIVGSGAVWACVNGAYSNDEVLLWRRDLNYGGYTGVLQDVSDKFPLVRKTYASGKILDAEKLLSSEFKRKGYNPQAEKPLPLAVLGLNFMFAGHVTGYSRTTDMASGEVEISFKHETKSLVDTVLQRCGSQRRRCFIARGSYILAYNVVDSGNFDLILGAKAPSQKPSPQNGHISYENDHVFFAARSEGGLDYGFVARVVAIGGTVKGPGGEPRQSIEISGADNVTIYVKTFNDSNRDAEFKKLKAELSLIKSYDKLFISHSTAHKKLFDSYALSLDGADVRDQDLPSMLSQVKDANLDSGLVARLWNMGKYLAICGVSPSDVSLFNSAQLLYCGGMSDVLQDMMLEFFEVYEKYASDLKKNAVRIFGTQGYFIPSVISPKSALIGAVDPGTIHFIASSALAANIFYRYYLLTGDVKVLKSRIFPMMREVCNFYSDFLKLDSNGFYTTIPSYSPMSTPGNIIAGRPLKDFAFSVNSTIDFLAIECLLDNLIDSASVCGASHDVPMWQDMKTKLPPFAVTNSGDLREYTNSAFVNGAVNCGTMHAYGLWPIKSISFNDKNVVYQPTVAVGSAAREQAIGLRRASFNAVMSRLEVSGAVQDARSILVCALQASHSGLGKVSGDCVREMLLKLVDSCVSPSGLFLDSDFRGSGFTKVGPGEVDICANIGFMNTVTECIMQSNQNTLRILPCVFDAISAGRLTDVITDFAAKISMDWDIKKGRCVVKIMPKASCKISIEANRNFRKIKNKEYAMQGDSGVIKDVQLTAGKQITLEFA